MTRSDTILSADHIRIRSEVEERLDQWSEFSDKYWVWHPDDPSMGWFGTGYNNWGVQTNKKYIAAMAALAEGAAEPRCSRVELRAKALAALRFSLWSHHAGGGSCSDGTPWGHTWISALGIERMMFAVEMLRPYLSTAEQDLVKAVLVSESDWILNDFHRGDQYGVVGDRWNSSGKNGPESNLWAGSLLARTAALAPEHENAGAWSERAREFLINSVSVPADADSSVMVDGMAVADRFRGANFFPSFGLDHHGYFNLGYMALCVSNATILHFDLTGLGQPVPESLYHHQHDLWQVVKRMTFPDGRLARIGGDSRTRYTYCQEYVMPSLLFAASVFHDPDALQMLRGLLDLVHREQEHNGDGSFYGERLGELAEFSPYYITRLETDRACSLAMVLAYLPLTEFPASEAKPFESSNGGWSEPEHGAAVHRSDRRLASFSWRSLNLTQGLCLPPQDSSLGEWDLNLVGEARVYGDERSTDRPGKLQTLSRELVDYTLADFAGGFVTVGSVIEGRSVSLDEGWRGSNAAESYIGFAALPDDRTVVGFQRTVTADWRVYMSSIKGIHLNVPNDLFNGFSRQIETGESTFQLTTPSHDEIVRTGSSHVCIDGKLGLVGIYGGEEISISRAARRRGGARRSLYVEQFCYPMADELIAYDPGSVVFDYGYATMAGADSVETAAVAGSTKRIDGGETSVRAISVRGADDHSYVVAVNLHDEPGELALDPALRYSDLVTSGVVQSSLAIAPRGGVVLRQL